MFVSLCCSKVFWATLRSNKSTADEEEKTEIEARVEMKIDDSVGDKRKG